MKFATGDVCVRGTGRFVVISSDFYHSISGRALIVMLVPVAGADITHFAVSLGTGEHEIAAADFVFNVPLSDLRAPDPEHGPTRVGRDEVATIVAKLQSIQGI
ncbi:hypothetical protein ACFFMN_40455 [Planobispora siamensis]|uniref:Uncharacterized protein n=1 Tax=Planobispora siamensis TaxID=936338 RepID=A0A8J3SNS3_9ACTN|nr:hypothetical protein [Planobispora siamensis]GIH97582.1 hypothetical protein Psi01_82120 [Planobispora siamensis]